jgi:hypothetical protein
VARLGGVDKMRLSGLSVDRDAGYVIIWAESPLFVRLHDAWGVINVKGTEKMHLKGIYVDRIHGISSLGYWTVHPGQPCPYSSANEESMA